MVHNQRAKRNAFSEDIGVGQNHHAMFGHLLVLTIHFLVPANHVITI
jgi:hypothetical protein